MKSMLIRGLQKVYEKFLLCKTNYVYTSKLVCTKPNFSFNSIFYKFFEVSCVSTRMCMWCLDSFLASNDSVRKFGKHGLCDDSPRVHSKKLKQFTFS